MKYRLIDLYVVTDGKIDWKATANYVRDWTILNNDDGSASESIMESIALMKDLRRMVKKYGSKAIVDGKRILNEGEKS